MKGKASESGSDVFSCFLLDLTFTQSRIGCVAFSLVLLPAPMARLRLPLEIPSVPVNVAQCCCTGSHPKTQWHVTRSTYSDVHGTAKLAGTLCFQCKLGSGLPHLCVFWAQAAVQTLWKGFCTEMSLVQAGVPSCLLSCHFLSHLIAQSKSRDRVLHHWGQNILQS